MSRSINPFAAYLHTLQVAQPNILYLRDGELVVYKRKNTLNYQCRFKLADGIWTRRSTNAASVEQAVANACNIYDEARFRQKLGLAQETHDIAQVAKIASAELRREIDKKQRKSSFNDYVRIIERDFVPYFGERRLETLTNADIKQFELWRDRRNLRTPTASTLNNYAAAWSRLVKTAVDNGYLSEATPVPKLSTVGVKSVARPAFSQTEVQQMLEFMHEWKHKAERKNGEEMRLLVCDYIEVLLYTGMRHGTEAMNLRWCDVEWHINDGQRYLRLWVSGKTGGRWLIAKHKALPALQRLQARQPNIQQLPFDELLTSRVQRKLFCKADGYMPKDFAGVFERLMKDSGLLRDTNGQIRTLYSMRHTYATLELLNNGTDIHTLSKQLGNSAAMIERHYSKLTATMAAKRLAK